MTTLQMVLAIVLIVLALALTTVILLQKGREADASAVGASTSNNQFFDKTAGHQKDDTLANITKVLGVIFFLVSLATVLVTVFVK